MVLGARRLLLVSAGLVLLGSAGCSKPPATGSPPALVSATIPELVEGWTNWPVVTPGNYKISPRLAAFCRAIPTGTEGPAGPHLDVPIKVHVHPVGVAAMTRQASRVFPSGTVIVKAKYSPVSFVTPPDLGIMIKREAGFDPSGGDWEYAYVTAGTASETTRGVIANCKECHARQQKNDFVFGSYLGGPQDAPPTPYP